MSHIRVFYLLHDSSDKDQRLIIDEDNFGQNEFIEDIVENPILNPESLEKYKKYADRYRETHYTDYNNYILYLFDISTISICAPNVSSCFNNIIDANKKSSYNSQQIIDTLINTLSFLDYFQFDTDKFMDKFMDNKMRSVLYKDFKWKNDNIGEKASEYLQKKWGMYGY